MKSFGFYVSEFFDPFVHEEALIQSKRHSGLSEELQYLLNVFQVIVDIVRNIMISSKYTMSKLHLHVAKMIE